MALIALLLPWWDEESGLGVETLWPKATAVAAIAVVAAGAWAKKRADKPPVALCGFAVVLWAISMVGFYMQVDNTIFAEKPFTHHVRVGFFVCAVAWLFAALAFVTARVEGARPLRFPD